MTNLNAHIKHFKKYLGDKSHAFCDTLAINAMPDL